MTLWLKSWLLSNETQLQEGHQQHALPRSIFLENPKDIETSYSSNIWNGAGIISISPSWQTVMNKWTNRPSCAPGQCYISTHHQLPHCRNKDGLLYSVLLLRGKQDSCDPPTNSRDSYQAESKTKETRNFHEFGTS